MFVREYRIHLVNGEVIRIGECVEKEEDTPILDQYLDTEENSFLEIGPADGPQVFIPVRNILYVSVRPVPDH